MPEIIPPITPCPQPYINKHTCTDDYAAELAAWFRENEEHAIRDLFEEFNDLASLLTDPFDVWKRAMQIYAETRS